MSQGEYVHMKAVDLVLLRLLDVFLKHRLANSVLEHMLGGALADNFARDPDHNEVVARISSIRSDATVDGD